MRNPIEALDLVDDPGRGLAHELMSKAKKSTSCRRSRHRAQAHDVFVSPAFAHRANGLHRQQRSKGLLYLIVEAGFGDRVDIDGSNNSGNVDQT